MCTYSDDRSDVLLSYLYGDIDPAARAAFEAHLPSCADCTSELAELGAVRTQLARWTPPEPKHLAVPATAARGTPRWWHDVPAWAQVAAALLVLGTVAGLANLEVRYDANGFAVRTGWSGSTGGSTAASEKQAREGGAADPAGSARPASADRIATPSAGQPSADAWRVELAALENRLRQEMRAAAPGSAARLSAPARAEQGRRGPVNPVNPVKPVNEAALLARVQALIAESERRQQRELALRVGDVLRDVNAQRQADLVRIDRTLGAVERNTGVEVMRQRETLDYLIRTTQTR